MPATVRTRAPRAPWYRGSALAGACAVGLCAGGGCGGGGHDPGSPMRVVGLLGGPGKSPGQFAYPRAIDADDRGLWVIDKSARVQRLDATTGAVLASWRMPRFENGKPTGVTVWPRRAQDAVVYVADTHEHRVMAWRVPPAREEEPGRRADDDAPPTVLEFGSFGRGPGQFIFPTDVGVLPTPDGRGVARLYVTEYGGNDRVSVFDGAGAYQFSFGRWGTAEDPRTIEFNRPQSIVVDAQRGEVIVADSCNHRLGRFSLDGALLGWVGSLDEAGEAPGRFL